MKRGEERLLRGCQLAPTLESANILNAGAIRGAVSVGPTRQDPTVSGPSFMALIFPSRPARPCPPSGQCGTVPGSPAILWAPPPDPRDPRDHAPMACVLRMPMPWRCGKIQILGFQGCVPRRGGAWNSRFRAGSAFLYVSECPRCALHL
jgi:hypothetical protein